jgi:Tfp pilus assembly protein PilE
MCNNKGISLVAVVIVMLIVAILALVIASFMSSGSIASITDMQAEQAFYIANAGMECYLELLEADSDWSTPPAVFTNQAFGAGTFTITYTNQATNSIDITSTGKVTGWDGNSVQRVISQHVTKSDGSGGYPGGVPAAFSYGIHCFGSNVDFKSSTGTVNGNVASTNNVKNYGSMTINGTVTQDSPVPDPGPVDMAGYLAIADVVQPGNYIFNAGTYGSPGSEQVWYIQGNATINSNVTIYGSVIADGQVNISSKSSITITAASGYPAIISGSNISVSSLSNSAITGLIYSENNITFNSLSNVTMNTSMLAGNNISIKSGSNFSINYSSDISTNPPPYFSGYSDGSITMTTSLWQETL